MEVIRAELSDARHAEWVVAMIDAYARDPMGLGAPLAPEARTRLIPGLREHPTCVIFLAIDNDQPLGIAVCFQGFSTFRAQRLINIHDLAVVPQARGRGVGGALIDAVAAFGRANGFCRVSLEVRPDNQRAMGLYRAKGFSGGDYGAPGASMQFWEKPL